MEEEMLPKAEEVMPKAGEEQSKASKGKISYPNTLMMASSKLEQNCSVCRRTIQSGDSFIYCVKCGHPGHWAHLGEMIKVTGKCPVCKQRLTQNMYDV
jgi:hypothetical protein